MKRILPILAATAFPLLAQGPLTPPGAPAPTQKSLQEIWDKIGTLQNTVASQQQQLSALQQQNTLLLESAGVLLPWQIVTIDHPGSVPGGGYIVDVGEKCSLAFTPAGYPSVAYYHPADGDLKYAIFNGSTWIITPVDTAGDVGRACSMALAPSGQPAIAYQDFTNADLKYAVFNGSAWTLTTVDSTGNVGRSISLAFSPAGQPAIAYNDTSAGAVNYAVFDGSTWQIQPVASIAEANDGEPSLAFSPQGQPTVAFHDGDLTAIKYAVFNGSAWTVETVEEQESFEEYANASLAFSPSGLPAICYDSYPGGGVVRYAVKDGDWNFSDVEHAGDWGANPSLAFSPGGQANVAFSLDPYGPDPYPLRLGRLNGSTWDKQDIGPVTVENRALFCSLAFNRGGQPAVCYFEGGDLRFAVRALFSKP